MQQYQEDSFNALGASWDLAKSYYLPWERMAYDPRMFSIGRGAVNAGAFNPFRRGSIINNPVTRWAGSAVVNTTKNFGWAKNIASSETGAKAITDVTKWHSKISTNFNAGGVMMKDGWFGISNTPYNQTNNYKELVKKQRSLESKISYRKSGKPLIELQKNRSDFLNKANINRYSSSINTRTSRGYRGTNRRTINNPKLLKVIDDKITNYNSVTRGLQGKLFGTKLLKVGNQAGHIAAQVGIRGLAVMGKLNAYSATAGLAYSIISSVANPIAQAGVNAIDQAFTSLQSLSNPEIGGRLELGFLSQGAVTERQRAIQAISKSRINGRSMLGHEASYMR